MSKLGNMKLNIINCLYRIANVFEKKICHIPKIVNAENTLKYIIENNVSVSRYGDGEYRWIKGLEQNTFQDFSKDMSERLEKILKSDIENHIVCIPDWFGELKKYKKESQLFIKAFMGRNRIGWLKLLNNDKIYYDALISRFYYDYADKSESEKIIKLWRKLFKGKELLIVEGKFSRLGVGNNFFDGVSSIERILCPAENAFNYYHEILNKVKKYSKNRLVLIALGPTATILAYDLAMEGIQAIDVGHLDIEYEWYKMNATKKVPVKFKYVNEAADKGGRDISDIEDKKVLDRYLAQVVDVVGVS